MVIELSEKDIKLLLSLKDGISKILIYAHGSYPEFISFVLKNGKTVTLLAKDEYIAPKFEVFTVAVSEKIITTCPEKIIELRAENLPYKVAILQKSEWDVLASEEDKAQLIGDPHGATIQHEGKPEDIPNNAINEVTLPAGIEITDANGWSFMTATSMFPLALYVSDCDFSEPFDPSIYERIELS